MEQQRELSQFFQNTTLTNSQRTAIEKLEQFLKGKDDLFLLKGYAGTGKTFILEQLSHYLAEIDCPFQFLAPTGRAAKVIRKRTKQNATTIHRQIYRMDPVRSQAGDEDGEEYKLYFKIKNEELPHTMIFIVDEASMVSDTYNETETLKFGSGKLLRDFFQYVNCQKTNRKIIFLGDNAQLPPVNSNLSPALSIDYLKKNFNLTIQEHEMTDVYRQAQDSGILKTATSIRSNIQEKNYDAIKIKSNNLDITEIPIEKTLDLYEEKYHFEDEDNIIVIGQTNDYVYKYNRAIRKRLGFNPSVLEPNDRLLIIKNTMINHITLFNGDFVTVNYVSSKREVRTVRLRNIPEPVHLLFRDVIISVSNEKGESQKISCKIFENLLFSNEREMSHLELRAFLVDFQKRNPQLKPNTNLYIEKLNNDPYFNALHVKFGYAITCHKAQGGEWHDVIVDFRYTNSIYCEEYFRWAYTAITRSKKSIYTIYPPNAEKYLSNEEANTNFSAFIGQLKEKLESHDYHLVNVKYFQYHFILDIKTIRNEVIKTAIYFNAKFIISSIKLLNKINAEEEGILQSVLKPYTGKSIIQKDHQQVEKVRVQAVKTNHLKMPQGSSTEFIQDEILPILSVHRFYFIGIVDVQNGVKLKGLISGSEVSINFYHNQDGQFTKMYIEKGKSLLQPNAVSKLMALLQ